MSEIKDSTAEQSGRGRKILITGEVVSNKMAKTICVQVFRTVRHAKYGKFLKRSSIFKAHDEKSTAQVGDVVEIRETRPLSKTKRFQLVRVITKSANVVAETGAKL